MWIRFNQDHAYRPDVKPPITVRYRAGAAYSVVHGWAKDMIAAGVAVRIATPRKGAKPNAQAAQPG